GGGRRVVRPGRELSLLIRCGEEHRRVHAVDTRPDPSFGGSVGKRIRGPGPVDRLGTFALVLGLALAVYGLISSVIGARRNRPVLVESARTSAYSLLAVVAAANGAMLAAILSNDFRIQYVAENSSRATPTFFKILSLWSADQGSLLLWNLVLAGYIAAVAYRFRR